MFKKLLIGLCFASCVALLCVGCSSAPQKAENTSEPTTSEAPALRTVGTPADGAYEIELTNGLADEILNMVITITDEESNDAAKATNIPCSINTDETVNLYYKAPADATVDATYTVTVSTNQGKTMKFELLPLANMKNARLMMDGELCYLTYTDKSGVSKSTKDAVEAAAAASAADQAAVDAAAEQAAAAQYSEDVPTDSDYGYTETYSDYPDISYENSSAGSYEDTGSSGGSSQSEDSCVSGGVALR